MPLAFLITVAFVAGASSFYGKVVSQIKNEESNVPAIFRYDILGSRGGVGQIVIFRLLLRIPFDFDMNCELGVA